MIHSLTGAVSGAILGAGLATPKTVAAIDNALLLAADSAYDSYKETGKIDVPDVLINAIEGGGSGLVGGKNSALLGAVTGISEFVREVMSGKTDMKAVAKNAAVKGVSAGLFSAGVKQLGKLIQKAKDKIVISTCETDINYNNRDVVSSVKDIDELSVNKKLQDTNVDEKLMEEIEEEIAGKGGSGATENSQSYLKKALENQGLDKTPNRLKEVWTGGDYKYTV